MGKPLRCWHKLSCSPLRLSLLIICAWAVYTISTGFIYPSVRSARTFTEKMQRLNSRRQVNRNLSLDNLEDDLNHHFEEHHPVPKSDMNQAKFKTEVAEVNKKSSQYEKLTMSSRSSSLPMDSLGRKETAENTDGQKKGLTYGQGKKKYKTSDSSYHGKINVKNSTLKKLTNDIFFRELDYQNFVSSGRREQARKKSEMKNNPEESAIEWYKSKTYLPNIGNIKNYGLITSSSTTFLAPYSYQKMLIYPDYHPHPFQKTTHPSHVSSGSSKVKIVLLWTPLFKGWNFLPQGTSAFSHCPQPHCEVTSNRNRLNESHAVIFHIRTMSLLDLPPFRPPHQKWIFFSLEPPPQSYFRGFHFMYRMFNWTMTYRKDSDIVIPYGRVSPGSVSSRNNKKGKDWKALWKNKTRPIVWMVSHCDTYSKREHFVRQLQKFIDVDILGGCGSAVCLFNQTYKCLEAFSRRYKFFLAFENSICDDYVTEKFFRALRYDIVPVVLGGANYKAIGPPISYINAADFRSPKELAEYLHKVSENSTLYRTYFKWKEDGYTVEDKPNHCSLCEKIHSLDFKAKSTYTNIAKWWVEKSHCTKWTPK